MKNSLFRLGNIGTIITIVTAIVGVIFSGMTIQASVDFQLQSPSPESFPVGLNKINIICKNGGGQVDAYFHIILRLCNATFSSQTTMPYFLIDNQTVKFRFNLHQGEKIEKTVYFIVNERVSGFSIELSLEKNNFFDLLKSNGLYPVSLEYAWDEEQNRFLLVHWNEIC